MKTPNENILAFTGPDSAWPVCLRRWKRGRHAHGRFGTCFYADRLHRLALQTQTVLAMPTATSTPRFPPHLKQPILR